MFDSSTWEKVRKRILKSVTSTATKKFVFMQVTFIKTELVDGGPMVIYLGVPTSFHQQRVENSLMVEILGEINKEISTAFKVNFEIVGEQTSFEGSLLDTTKTEQKLHVLKDKEVKKEGRVENFTFKNFIASPQQDLLIKALKHQLDFPGELSNPLYIYGKTGTGKTHLLRAFSHESFLRNDGSKVIYTSGEGFLNDFMKHIRLKDMHRFQIKYRNDCDVLLLDDISCLGSAKATQLELRNILDHFIQFKKVLMVTSLLPANEVTGLDDMLLSRLSGGLSLEIKPHNYESAIELIKFLSFGMNLNLSQDLISYLAKNFEGDVRSLKGLLIKLGFLTRTENGILTIELAKDILNIKDSEASVNPDSILEQVSSEFKITIKDLKSKSRLKHIVKARSKSMFMMRRELKLSLSEIGVIHGGRDHSTVMNGIKKYQEFQKTIVV